MLRSLLAYRPGHRAVQAVFAALMIGLLFAAPAAQPQSSEALGRILAQKNLSSTSDQSEIPQIAFGGGRLAASWAERESSDVGFASTGVDAAWGRGVYIGAGLDSRYQNADVGVDLLGNAHLVYAAGDKVYHRARRSNGTLSSTHVIASVTFPNAVRMAIAPKGTIWVIWRDGDGTAVYYKFSRDGGLTWVNGSDGGIVKKESGNMFSPEIAVDRNNVPHVLWYMRSSGPFRGDIRIADWVGTRFEATRLTSDGNSLFDADPSMAVDGNNVQHIVWRKQTGANWVIYYSRRPAGGSWEAFTPVAITRGDAGYGPSIGVDETGAVSITYSNLTSGSSRRIQFFSKLPENNWEGPVALSKGRWDSRSNVVGANSATGITAHVVHQHEQGTDDGDVIYTRVLLLACSEVREAPADEGISVQATSGRQIFFPLMMKPKPRPPGCE
jgi:hypothetical protein